ncbi:hypothetical protein ACFPJ1_40605 [Kribbella qitaiheensis]|uniref:hypothetical protein n=1 Tax=Kribbella qitaiheensis TaxID=1544730 RepID=UPI00360DE4DD
MGDRLGTTCECTCGLAGCAGNVRDKQGRPIQHGTANTYGFHGCRCGDCTEAHYAKDSQMRARNNSATREVAGKHREEWTSADLEIATRPDLTAREAALKLGRTMHAVKNIRKKAKADPKLKARVAAKGRKR